MKISVNGYRVTVSETYVNRYKNDPENCPVCKGKNVYRCPLTHPRVEEKQRFDPKVWIHSSEDKKYHGFAVYNSFGYRRRDDVRIAQLKLKLKELKIDESEFLGVERDVFKV